MNKKHKRIKENIITRYEKKRRPMSIRVKLILFFACLSAAVLVIIWLFQIILLDFFYKQTKETELNYVANEIAANLTDDEIDGIAIELAVKYDTCIRVYKADSGQLGGELVSADISPTCVLHHSDDENMRLWYYYAKRNGGEWRTQRRFTVVSSDDGNGVIPAEKGVSAVYVRIVTAENRDYAIMLNTEFKPMDSTVRTLAVQFFWIAAAVLVVATVMALVFSADISRPLAAMNNSAKKLAMGDYEPNFREEGYLEARELAATLNFAAAEISKSDELQRELIANVSHDLRTPLTMISGYAEVMRDIPGENSPENLQIVIDEAGRLSQLVTDLLDISSLKAGTKEPEPTVFNLTETVREVMARYNKLVKHDGYHIDFVFDSEVNVFADRTMMLQVIYNLVNNAVNYTGDDKHIVIRQTVSSETISSETVSSETVSPETVSPETVASDSAWGEKVRISVTDTGAGIPRDQIPLIWDRYYKVDKVHRRSTVGSGLGLSIVKGILRSHRAAYGVESRVGAGSTFWFELPRYKN